jgi:phage terminase large subunit|tara:strand:- start:69 stop:1400 length:1332 start_codon:yes stop_codon:yes gene_type:complete
MDIEIPYAPRPQQFNLHADPSRFKICVSHRRWGKSVYAITELLRKALEIQTERSDGRFMYLAPYYRQAKQVAWDYLCYYTRDIPGTKINQSELRVDLINGSRIRLAGAGDDPDALRGIFLDGIVLDEYADMSPRVWSEICRPALVDRKGWAIFIGTPKGKNHFWQLYENAEKDKEWTRYLFKASETGVVAPEELVAARKEMGEDEFQQEFECSWSAAIKGSYYGSIIEEAESDGRVSKVEVDPALPVHVAWDLGISDSCSLWFFQVTMGEVRFVDFYEHSGVGLEHYVKVMEQKGYWYGDDWLPHDAKVRELGTGRTRAETLVNMGRRPRIVTNHKVEDGINAARLLLHHCWFDELNCEQGINSLRSYQREWDDVKRVFRKTPLHNWASHAADSFRYASMAYRNIQPEKKVPGLQETLLQKSTLDEMWNIHDKETFSELEPRI